jgi:hypothetical protein
MAARLLLGSAHAVKVWLNGKQVYDGKPGTAPAGPDQAGADVELQSGKNRVVIEVRHQGDNAAIFARFLDPNRKLRYPEPERP